MLEKIVSGAIEDKSISPEQRRFWESIGKYVDGLKADGFEDRPVETREIVYSIDRGRIIYYPKDQRFESIDVDRSVREVFLTPKENQLFNLLVKSAQRVVDKETIARRIWGEEAIGGTKNDLVKKYVQRLRRKLEPDNKDPRLSIIHTVNGGGYMLRRAVSPIYNTPASISSQ